MQISPRHHRKTCRFWPKNSQKWCSPTAFNLRPWYPQKNQWRWILFLTSKRINKLVSVQLFVTTCIFVVKKLWSSWWITISGEDARRNIQDPESRVQVIQTPHSNSMSWCWLQKTRELLHAFCICISSFFKTITVINDYSYIHFNI
jgi:hypothetical protein